jgi:hypothetical protein
MSLLTILNGKILNGKILNGKILNGKILNGEALLVISTSVQLVLWAELAFIGSLMTFNKFEFFPMGENFDFF